MAGQFVTIKLMRGGQDSPWGFRLQGGREFQLPLSVIKVANGSLSEQAGLQASDIIVKINGRETEAMRHKEAQDAIAQAGNYLELYVERGAINTWRPSVTPVGDLHAGEGQVYTKTSLEHSPQKTTPGIGSGHNSSAKPFNGPALVHKQYNSPVNLYSEKNLEETLNAHTQVLATGATGINFMRPDAPVNKESAVYQMVRDEELAKAKGYSASPDLKPAASFQERSPIKSVSAPVEKPHAGGGAGGAVGGDANKNICAECERLIVGVFVRINNKSMHAECFRCSTCGSSLKNVGYFNINDKLYCDIHARQVRSFLGGGGGGGSVGAPVVPTSPVHSQAPLGASTNGYHNNSGSELHGATNGGPAYHQPTPPSVQPNGPSFGLGGAAAAAAAGAKKYSPVSPPTGPKPFVPGNRNSMYINSPAPFVSETIETKSTYHTDWPPSNVVTSNFASSSTTTSSQTMYVGPPPPGAAAAPAPAPAPLPATNFASQQKQPQQQQRPWGSSSSASNVNKSTFSDSRATPKRGRGQLQTQLTGGVIPFCGYCTQPIRGQYIMALNKTWCPAHFICANTLCKKSLEEHGFVEEQGRLYCETCYETHFAPNCAKCGQRIKGDCLNALGSQYHVQCFTCTYCKTPFGNSSFYMEDGLAYCERDWNDLFTTKCVGCGLPIAAGDRWVEALNNNYHSNCFRCTVCKGNLEGQSFFAKGGKPFCRAHAR